MRRATRRLDENHERWLVSYADFVTLMFAFFVVLFAYSTVDQTKMGMRMFALRVDDMAKTVEYLESKGVEFFQAPRETAVFEGLRAEILDPDGIRIELREWKAGDSFYNDDWQPNKPNVTKLN